MAQYMLSVYVEEGATPPADDEMEQIYKDVDTLNEKIRASGAWVFAGGLHPSDIATVVRVEDNEVMTTDGPFAEAKEQLGGFWVIEADDLDAALALAAEGAVACRGPIEVRPFQDEPEV